MMAKYIKTPVGYEKESPVMARTLEGRVAMIDNFIELIIFTPRGSFVGDEDFGFEYWNYEYSNVHFKSFNNGLYGDCGNGMYAEATLKECKESIEKSLEAYEPQLKQVGVAIELGSVRGDRAYGGRLLSKYEVAIQVTGMLDDGLGTLTPYKKEVRFLMEPTVRRINI